MKRYKCPYCFKMIERNEMGKHINFNHQDMIPDDYTHNRLAFNILNKKEVGNCVECRKETEWNEDKKRYERFCSETCRKEAGKKAKANMNKVYNKDHLLDDPQVQIKMLKNRKISGTYKFKNGEKMDYVGKLEKSLLEYLDNVMNLEPKDIMPDYPIIKYNNNGVERNYIPDFYLPDYNLIIEVKDGGTNKNNNPAMKDTRNKTLDKEKAVKDLKKYNYLRLTNNNFIQLIETIELIKNSYNENSDDEPIHIINESTLKFYFNNIKKHLNG